jgi:hypothetical protein
LSRTYLCVRIDKGRNARRVAVLCPEGEPYNGTLRLASDGSGDFGMEVRPGRRYTLVDADPMTRPMSIEEVLPPGAP